MERGRQMTEEEACMAGYKIVCNAGLAKSKLIDALDAATNGNYEKAQLLIQKASELICKTEKLRDDFEQEAQEFNDSHLNLVVSHGNQHLMTTIVLRDYVCDLTGTQGRNINLPSIYKRYH